MVSKKTLLAIFENLVEDNIKRLKYLYNDLIGDAVLEKAKTNTDFLTVLDQIDLFTGENLVQFANNLKTIGRSDLADKLTVEQSEEKIFNNERRIPNGHIFQFDLHEDVICTLVEFKKPNDDYWLTISDIKQSHAYYLTRKKNNKLFVKVENLICNNENIYFRFSFEDSKKKIDNKCCNRNILGNCNYELVYNGIMIATPEPICNSEFSMNIKTPTSLDWREINKIYLDKVPYDHQSSKYCESIELFAQRYIDINFPATISESDIICPRPCLANKEYTTLIIDKFYHFFSENKAGICAILPGYHLHYHASLLKCNVESFRNCKDEDRIIMFYSELNLVIITRIAHSLDDIKLESENCLNDIILFINVNSPFIEDNNLNMLGVVVVPSIDRKTVKNNFFFLFSDSWNEKKDNDHNQKLKKILFLCKDDIEKENFEQWWKFVADYYDKKVENDNTQFFKTLIGLTMILMASVNIVKLPTIELNPQKQIQSLILNNEQWDAIYDTALKKIITGGYGSGKSIVGKEIVRNFIQKKENPFTLYYICCNHFSLFNYEMNKFVKYQKKESGNDKNNVICDNLYELWKKMPTNNGIKEERISIPKLLQFLVNDNINTNMNNINKVCFVLEELSPDHVKKEEAVQLNKLFSSVLKESVVVFIPESVEKYREMARSNEKHIIQKNYFNEKELGMKVFTLSKSMRVTISNKLLIDSSQDSISKSKTVCNFQNSNVYNELQRNKKTDQTPVKKSSSTDPKSDWIYESKVDEYTLDDVNHISTKIKESVIDITDKDYHEYDLDYVSKHVANQTSDSQTDSEAIVSNCFMETSYVFKSGSIGHLIEGEKPKVIYFPFHDITEKPSVKLLSFVLEHHCFKLKIKNTVICNTMEEIKSVAYAIDIIGKYKSVTYSPHLQKYNPKLAQKKEVIKNLKTGLDILVTDCKGFSGSESESVVVLVRPGEIYLRHILVDAISRSNSHLIVLVLDDNKVLLNNNGTIRNVLNDWSEDIFKKIKVDLFNNEDELFTKTDCLKIGEYCKDFIDRGAKKDFDAYKDDIKFQIIHENNTKIEDIANDLQANIKIKNALDNNIIAKKSIAMDVTIKNILVERVSSDWKRFARYCFTDIDSVNAIIDHINEDVKTKTKNDDENAEDNKSKMRCLLDKLYEHYPEDYKMQIKSSLKHINRNDVLQDIGELEILVNIFINKIELWKMNHNEKMIEIGKRLNEDNVAKIKYVLVNVIGSENIVKITNGHKMIKELERIGYVSENNYKDFINILDNLGRPDLISIINGEYQPELNKVDSHELTPSLIMEVAYLIAKNWRKFGRHLKLDETRDLDHIGVDSKTTLEKSIKVLNKWIKREEKQFLTWCNLREELESFERNDIVEEIQVEYMHKENNEFKNKMTPHQMGKVASKIANNWRNLGRHLNFDESELDHIYLDFKKKDDDKAYEILMGCKQKSNDGFLSWNYLKKVLELLDRTDIVTELQADFEH